MSSWKECKLGEVAEIIMGQSPTGDTCNTNGKGTPLLNGPTEFGIQFPKAVQFTISPKKISEINDILFCVRGSTTGRMNWANEHYALGRGLASIRHRQGHDYRYFIKALLDFNLPVILASATGSTFPNVSREQLENLDISLPPLEEQKAIAEILSSLDDKIDLLHRQNQTLESLAQTLFRQWFIEEAKEEWEEVTLSDVMELKYGKDHKHLNDGKIPIYGSGGIMRYGNTAIYENESILIPRKGTLSNIFYVDEPFWTVDTIFWSKINSEKISGKLLFEFLKTLNFSNMNVGSAVPSLTTKVLNEISFALPSLEEQEEFKQYTDNAWDKVKQNKKQIQTLENLRDTLLPKLLSGEVRVKI